MPSVTWGLEVSLYYVKWISFLIAIRTTDCPSFPPHGAGREAGRGRTESEIGVGEKDSSRRSTRPESGRNLAKGKEKEELIAKRDAEAAQQNIEWQERKGMHANDERELKRQAEWAAACEFLQSL